MDTIDLICLDCEHFCSNNNDGILCGCRAFPKGIPYDYPINNKHDKIIKKEPPGTIVGIQYPEGQVGDYIYKPLKTN
jgi:hypothetical protein